MRTVTEFNISAYVDVYAEMMYLKNDHAMPPFGKN